MLDDKIFMKNNFCGSMIDYRKKQFCKCTFSNKITKTGRGFVKNKKIDSFVTYLFKIP